MSNPAPILPRAANSLGMQRSPMGYHVHTQTLEEDGVRCAVTVRPFQVTDAQSIYEVLGESDADIPTWIPDLNSQIGLEGVRTWMGSSVRNWAEGTSFGFAIIDTGEGTILGGCGLSQINRRHRFANMNYWVRSSRTGQGIATAAVPLVARFGFEQQGLNRIEIVVATGNAASVRVAEKAGARREGRQRNRICIHDRAHDAWMFSLIPSDLVDKEIKTGGAS